MNQQAALAFDAPSLLIKRFCAEYSTSEREAKARFEETKKFLILCATNREGGFTPSKEIDAMWHQFLLHSRDYFRFCDLLDGYIHHQPADARQSGGYKKTLTELARIFGQINDIYWKEQAADCDDCSSTCDCCP